MTRTPGPYTLFSMTTNIPVTTTVHTSPHTKSPDADDYAKDGFHQYELVNDAVRQHVGRHLTNDLRGRGFAVTVSDDGLTVTVVEADSSYFRNNK